MPNDTANNQPLNGSNSEDFMKLMKKALTSIESVDRATDSANDSLQDYAKSFDLLNAKLERYINLSRNIKTHKFDKVTITEKVKSASGNDKSSSNNKSSGNNKYANESARITDNVMNTIFRSIDNIGGKQARIVSSAFKKIYNSIGDAKTIANSIKAAKGLSGASQTATAAAGLGSKAMLGLSASTLGATAVISGIVVALGAMGAAGKYAYERNMDVNRSLMMLGDTTNELTGSSSKTANQMIGIKNTWTRIGDDLAGVFEPVFTMIVDFINNISNAVENITSPLDKEKNKQFTSSDSKVRWYTSKLENTSGEPENNSLPVIGNIASTAKQSGFDNDSAANLAIGTYDMAMQKARQYGVEASEVAQKLADAWATGSDAASQYGVVVDDQTLIGYMASKGVDIVNTQISDAMKQYYRYDLMQTELNADSNDAMQQQIKDWKQLGMQIDTTKQKLFSFDEVIQLGAVNTDIPIVGTPGVNYPSDESGSIPPVINPGVPGSGAGSGSGTGSGAGSGSGAVVPSIDTSVQQENLNNLNTALDATYAKLNNVNSSINFNNSLVASNSNLLSENIVALANNGNALDYCTIMFNINNATILRALQAWNNARLAVEMNSNALAVNGQSVANVANYNQMLYGSLVRNMNGFSNTVVYANKASTGIIQVGNSSMSTKYKVDSLSQSTQVLIGRLSQAIQLQAMLGSSSSSNSSSSSSNSSSGGMGLVPYNSGISSSSNKYLGSSYAASSGGSTGLVPFNNGSSYAANGGGGSLIPFNNTVSSNTSSNTSSSSSSGVILSAIDVITEGADLINSLKDKDTGEYDWNQFLPALGSMLGNSITMPIETVINSVASGYNQTKEHLGSSLLGVVGGGLGGIAGLAGFVVTELLGDFVALTDVVNDATGDIFNIEGAIGNTNDWFNSLLNSMVNGDVLGLNYMLKSATEFANNAAAGLYTPKMATGGIGTKETTIRAFEGNRKEAVIPLETQAGVDYLANAMRQAGGGEASNSGSTQVYLTLSGVNIADNDAQWQRVGEKIAEVIDIQRQRRGELNYGSSF